MFVVLLAVAAMAQSPKESLKAIMSAQKIVVRDAKETKQSANTVKPGDIVEYTVEYRNESAQALRNVQGLLPIPKGMTYVGISAKPVGAQASTDGKSFEAMPLKRFEKQPNGGNAAVIVPLKEYRELRWDLGDIAPKSSKTVSARVQVTVNP